MNCAAQYQPLGLKGPLGRSTHIPDNNFCIVDFRNAPLEVDVKYVGANGTALAAASRQVTLKPAALAREVETDYGMMEAEIA